MLRKVKALINDGRQNITSIIRKTKINYSIHKEYVEHISKTVNCKNKWYGSSYGGFYVNPDLLNNNSIVYSFGIGKDITFDLKIIKKHGCRVYGFDPTPKSIKWISEQKISELFLFNNFGIGLKNEMVDFYLPDNPKQVSGSLVKSSSRIQNNKIPVQMKSFDQITSDLSHNHIDVLKMDIEGAEYLIIEHIMNSQVTIDQILIEFHDREFDATEPRSRKAIELLRKNGYEIFAFSKSYEEVSLIHNRKT